MATPVCLTSTDAAMPFKARLSDYCALTKPEVNLLVLMATGAGYALALHGNFDPVRFLHLLVGTLLVASGTATLNQVMEKIHDGQMRRTARRPLPSGRLQSRNALWFGVLLSIAGALELTVFVNWSSAALAVATLLMYLLIYTPLKRRTALCTLIGAIPGAMPVLIGWTGAARIDSRAWLLFALLFLWQFPHFLAIALMYREDYERAGYRMLPARDTCGRLTRLEIVGFAVAVTIAVFAYIVFQGPTPASLICASITGAFLLFCSIRLALNASRLSASRLLHATVLYLPIVLVMLITHKY
jgi:protoheme IX farnesyltransferase